MAESKKIKVAQRGFSSKHFLEISCYIEEIQEEKYRRFSDLIFFELSPDYNRNKKIVLYIHSIDLRALSYGIKEVIKRGESSFIKYTDPKRANAAGEKKSISLETDKKNIYINVLEGSKKTGFGMDYYAAASVADMIVVMAEETERALYRLQQKEGWL